MKSLQLTEYKSMQWLLDVTFGGSCVFRSRVLAILPLAITVAVVTWVAGFVSQFLGPNAIAGRALVRLGLHFATNNTAAYAVGAAWSWGSSSWSARWCRQARRTSCNASSTPSFIESRSSAASTAPRSNSSAWWIRRETRTSRDAGRLLLLRRDQRGRRPGPAGLPERFRIHGREYHIVIVPTAPVPVGGGLLFIPADMVQPTDVSVEGLMSMYVSMGVTAPQFLPQTEHARERGTGGTP
jgi:hypothetical protein